MNLSRKGWFHVLASWLIARAARRVPDFIVRNQHGDYLRRWWLIPRNPLLNLYLHQIVGSDDDRALHCHPWLNCSLILRGGYTEVVPLTQLQNAALDYAKGWTVQHRRVVGDVIGRSGTARHRLVHNPALGDTWTLFLTGPVYRRWGFHCRHGWRHWRAFTDARDKGRVGAGCGD